MQSLQQKSFYPHPFSPAIRPLHLYKINYFYFHLFPSNIECLYYFLSQVVLDDGHILIVGGVGNYEKVGYPCWKECVKLCHMIPWEAKSFYTCSQEAELRRMRLQCVQATGMQTVLMVVRDIDSYDPNAQPENESV